MCRIGSQVDSTFPRTRRNRGVGVLGPGRWRGVSREACLGACRRHLVVCHDELIWVKIRMESVVARNVQTSSSAFLEELLPAIVSALHRRSWFASLSNCLDPGTSASLLIFP